MCVNEVRSLDVLPVLYLAYLYVIDCKLPPGAGERLRGGVALLP